jgi:predicted AlkP superfamily phosphohydrolase/phosphomutase
MGMRPKLLVIGLDGAVPELVFRTFSESLPNLRRLMENGTWGTLESTIPPITVPAWTCMMTGKDPGQLGLYGFRNRLDYSSSRLGIANALSVTTPTVWDILSAAGKEVVLVGVPQTYPPKPVNGYLISCFLTPSAKNQYTYPADLREEIESRFGTYLFDVEQFRTEDKNRLVKEIYQMTEKRFQVVHYLLQGKPWDFFMLVEIGVDRIHHGFWRFLDPLHPQHIPGSPFGRVIEDYYRFIDDHIGRLISAAPKETQVLVVSDHGAQRMEGGIAVNEWLQREGYLVLEDKPPGVVPLEKCRVNWKKTRAWGTGGYYSRIFINLEGREAQGIVPRSEYDFLRAELSGKLQALNDPEGILMENRVFKPEEVYREINGFPPDLIVYFKNLFWRALGSVGMGSIYAQENDTGSDDANHSPYGIYIDYNPFAEAEGTRIDLNITEIAFTILSKFGIPI